MAAICTGNINMGIKKSLNDRMKDLSHENCPNFRMDNFNSGVRFGSNSELYAVHINLKEKRVLDEKLKIIDREQGINKKCLASEYCIAKKTLDKMNHRQSSQRSYLPKDILNKFKQQEREGKMPNMLRLKSAGTNSQRLIDLKTRLLYTRANSRLAKLFFVSEDKKNLEKIESARRKPVIKIYRPKSTPERLNTHDDSKETLLSRSESEFLGDPVESKDRIFVRNQGPTIRATTSHGCCKNQLLYPEYFIENAFKVIDDDQPARSVHIKKRPKTVGTTTMSRQASIPNEFRLRTEVFQPINKHMSEFNVEICNKEFIPKTDKYTERKSVYNSLKSKL